MFGLDQVLKHYGYADKRQQIAIVTLLMNAGCFELQQLISDLETANVHVFPYGRILSTNPYHLLEEKAVSDEHLECLKTWFKTIVAREIQSARTCKKGPGMQVVVDDFFAPLANQETIKTPSDLNLTSLQTDSLEAEIATLYQRHFQSVPMYYRATANQYGALKYRLLISYEQLMAYGLNGISTRFCSKFPCTKPLIFCDKTTPFTPEDMFMVISRDVLNAPANLPEEKKALDLKDQNKAIVARSSSFMSTQFLTLAVTTATFFAVRNHEVTRPILENLFRKFFNTRR